MSKVRVDEDIRPLSEFRAEEQLAAGEGVPHEEAKARAGWIAA